MVSVQNANPFFERIVAASRIGLVAPFAVRRALIEAGVVPPETVGPSSLARALPSLEEVVRLYVTADKVEAALADLRKLTAGAR